MYQAQISNVHTKKVPSRDETKLLIEVLKNAFGDRWVLEDYSAETGVAMVGVDVSFESMILEHGCADVVINGIKLHVEMP